MASPSTASKEIAMTHPTLRHALNWFEIPVRDIERAQRFYETLLGTSLRREAMNGQTLAVFPKADDAIGGALIAGPNAPEPAAGGQIVYLNAMPSLDAVLARVEAAGGRIATPKVQLPGDMGAFAHITDTEGNRVGLHAV
jgi:predicted enzyme related to lactoylglutathione lyase